LRLVDGLLPVFALFLPGGLFPRPLAIAALLLPFVDDSGLLLPSEASPALRDAVVPHDNLAKGRHSVSSIFSSLRRADRRD
jgi:hypothetical protein